MGLGDEGGGLAYFADLEGRVQSLYMGEMPFYWQHSFDSIDLWCWMIFHADLVGKGLFAPELFLREVEAQSCTAAVDSCILSLDEIREAAGQAE